MQYVFVIHKSELAGAFTIVTPEASKSLGIIETIQRATYMF